MPQDVQSATHPGRGTKRQCPHCGVRYYDLERRPVLCPKCHREYVAQAKLPPRSGKAAAAAAAPAPALSGADDTFEEDEALPLDHMEGEEGLIEEEEGDEDEEREE